MNYRIESKKRKHYPMKAYGGMKVRLACKVKVQVQFTLEQATKAQRESRGIVILFL
jgi:hypothetical protein